MGLDVGSSGCKCVAFSAGGEALSSAYREYQREPGQKGLDAAALFDDVCGVIRRCAEGLSRPGAVAAITVSSFGESFIPVSREGTPLAPVGMYTDGIGLEETGRLIRDLPWLGGVAGAQPNPMYALPRLMRFARLNPETANRAWKYLQIADFVIFRLCGEALIDHALACRALAFDISAGRWSDAILSYAGLAPEKLSTPVPTGTAAGTLRAALAKSLGLPDGVKVIVGSHDQITSAVGAGALRPGEAVVGTGSVECITPVFDRLILDPAYLAQNYASIPHAVPGRYVTYAFTMSGGSLLSWYRDRMVPHLKPVAAARGCSVYDLLNETCPGEPANLLVVPHFLGSGTPELDPLMTGAMSGFTLATDLAEMYRAILEGLCFELCYNRDRLARFGVRLSSLRATGGGARSEIWLRLKADILGVPVTPLAIADAGAVGGAMLAAVALGAYPALEDASAAFVKTRETIPPDPENARFYAKRYEAYKQLRQSVSPKETSP